MNQLRHEQNRAARPSQPLPAAQPQARARAATPRPAHRPEVIERLFARMAALYGVKFSEAFSTMPLPNLALMWAQDLADFSMDELSRGIHGCRLREWPPTLPEFMALCRPPILPEAAYHEAVQKLGRREQGLNDEWSHPAVFHAAMEISAFDLQRLPWMAIKARWCAVLERHLANPDCPPVPPVPLALAEPATRPPNAREQAALASLRERLSPVRKKPLTSFAASPPEDTTGGSA